MRSLFFSKKALKELKEWRETDSATFQLIFELVYEACQNPAVGRGKPEKLKYLPQAWSRRINKKDRLVYEVVDDEIRILSCRGHYED